MSISKTAAMKPDWQAHDSILIAVICILLLGGLVVLTSASVSVAERMFGDPLHYLEQQLIAAVLGVAMVFVMLRIPSQTWERCGLLLVLAAFALLLAVFVPGLGQTVNGSTRWIKVAGVNVQAAEPARLLLLMYLSGYAVRHSRELQARFPGFLKPMIVVAMACGLLLAQPDFGSATVLLAITLAVLFIAGARLRDFLLFTTTVGAVLTAAAMYSPYRLARITSFLDPWSDPYDGGFQLTQSLIAVGAGNWLGAGLGASVQKLFYLPEAHTDFVFAVLAEEFGLIGSIILIGLFSVLVWRILCVARESAARGRLYQANLAFGLAIWHGAQVFINVGVNLGMLPTKGLTLPLISYGRSSLIITLIGLGLLLRIDQENRQLARGSRPPRSRSSKK